MCSPGNVMPSIDRRVLEGVIFAASGLAWMAWLAWYRRALLTGSAILLALALEALSGSVAIDVGEIFIEDWVRMNENRNIAFTGVEELFKLGGVLLLASSRSGGSSRRPWANVAYPGTEGGSDPALLL